MQRREQCQQKAGGEENAARVDTLGLGEKRRRGKDQRNLESKDAKFLLVDPNQTVELRGEGLTPEINNRVEVTGTAFRSAVPTAPAAQVIQVDSVKRVEEGGCREAISKLEGEGVKLVKPGQATAAKAPGGAKSGSHAGIYAGVAASGGIGAAIALSGKKSTSP